MPVEEAARHQLYNDLESALGPESTSTLMSLLPPVGWADVATRQDLRVLENGIRAELHGQLGQLRSELHGEVGQLRSELRGELGELRSELHRGLRDLHDSQRTMLFSLLGAMFTLAALTWAATSFA